MNPTSKTTFRLLVFLAITDFAAAPAMLAVGGKHGPPPPAAVVSIAIGIGTIAGAYGLMRGASWARRLTLGALTLRLVTFVLSIGATIPLYLRASGILTSIASAVAVVLVVRTRRHPAVAVA